MWLAEGSPREAEAELKRALALLRPQVGDSHPAVADTLATLASKGSPLQPSVTPDTVAQHFSEPIAAERAVAV